MNSLKNKSNLSYGVNDNPFITTKIILRLKHIFAAFGGIIVVPLVISSLLGFDSTMSTAVMAGIILVILGLFPKFATLINTIPQPVLGGVGIVMF